MNNKQGIVRKSIPLLVLDSLHGRATTREENLFVCCWRRQQQQQQRRKRRWCCAAAALLSAVNLRSSFCFFIATTVHRTSDVIYSRLPQNTYKILTASIDLQQKISILVSIYVHFAYEILSKTNVQYYCRQYRILLHLAYCLLRWRAQVYAYMDDVAALPSISCVLDKFCGVFR
jgi:hypothetical protein